MNATRDTRSPACVGKADNTLHYSGILFLDSLTQALLPPGSPAGSPSLARSIMAAAIRAGNDNQEVSVLVIVRRTAADDPGEIPLVRAKMNGVLVVSSCMTRSRESDGNGVPVSARATETVRVGGADLLGLLQSYLGHHCTLSIQFETRNATLTEDAAGEPTPPLKDEEGRAGGRHRGLLSGNAIRHALNPRHPGPMIDALLGRAQRINRGEQSEAGCETSCEASPVGSGCGQTPERHQSETATTARRVTRVQTQGEGEGDRSQVAGRDGRATDPLAIWQEIGRERCYQLLRWGIPKPNGGFADAPRSIGDFLTYIRHHLAEAEKAGTKQLGPQGALEQLRKIVTLGVACFEQHGCPPRTEELVCNARNKQVYRLSTGKPQR